MLNYGDMHKNTPLHIAAENGHTNVVNVLLGSAANPLLHNMEQTKASDIANKVIIFFNFSFFFFSVR